MKSKQKSVDAVHTHQSWCIEEITTEIKTDKKLMTTIMKHQNEQEL